MHYSSLILTFASLASFALAAPTKSLERRADECSASSTLPTGTYLLSNNLWNEGAASPGGSQCFGVDSLTGDTLAWHTSWTWEGDPQSVKSYANVELDFTPKPLSDIKSIPSTWRYDMTPLTGVNADISYDIFTDADAANTGSGDHHDFEIMVWLADLGTANPISDGYGADGKPSWVATGIQIAGVNWDLAKGTSQAAGGGTVYSFVAEGLVTYFGGDIYDFFTYLAANDGFPMSQNLVYVAAGTEPFTGSGARLDTTEYSVSVN